MSRFPRLAIGAIQQGFDSQPIIWALMESLRRSGLQVQSFFSRACFPAYQRVVSVTGLNPRHLDSWLMSPAVCRDLFALGAGAADLAVVQGEFQPLGGGKAPGGDLETLCHWLALPRMVVIDASQIGQHALPDLPQETEGLLLDGVANERQRVRLSTALESAWGVPVLGVLQRTSRLQTQLDALAGRHRLSRELCDALANSFMEHWQPQRILEIASHRQMPAATPRQWHGQATRTKLTVAVAYDEAFNCYLPDTFDWLELLGAAVVDFSPLRDESLPPATDIVYLGCGHPELYAEALSENHCIKTALRNHLRAGRRIYAEGGGLGYLCQQMVTPRGELKRMVGMLPAAARVKHLQAAAVPVEVTVTRPNWLGERGFRLRGYRNCRWELEPLGTLAELAADEYGCGGLLGSFHVVGSLVHLNFAAQPEVLRRFFHARRLSVDVPDPWAAVH